MLATVAADSVVVTNVTSAVPFVRYRPGEFLPPGRQVAFEEVNKREPWPLATLTRRGVGQPLRISDLFSQRQYRGMAMYAELFRFLEVDSQVAFTVPTADRQVLCVTVNRTGKDFSDSDLDQLRALRRCQRAITCRTLDVRDGQFAQLTEREAEVMTHVAGGLANREVARRLGMSTRTVGKHLENIYGKIGAHSRTEAPACWHRALPRPGTARG